MKNLVLSWPSKNVNWPGKNLIWPASVYKKNEQQIEI
jgi:hypothetical protein